MPFGSQIGQFSLDETTTTVTPGPSGVPTLQINLEGKVSGDIGAGEAFGTMTFEFAPSMKSGTWSFSGIIAFPDGGGDTVNSQGTWEETGPNQWHNRGTGLTSGGRIYGIEFDGDSRTGPLKVTGQIFD